MQRKVIFVIIVLLVSMINIIRAESVKNRKLDSNRKSNLEAFWTDVPPILDGDMSDSCWKDAPIARGFLLVGTDTPAKYQTNARVCYDAENLYIFMHADASEFTQKELKNRKNFQHWGEKLLGYDNMGFLLEIPYNKHVDCLYFATNPLACRSDNRKSPVRGIDRFNPLKVRTSRNKAGWNAEMKIPFIELGSWYANLGSTPAVGANWNILFFRENGRFKEASTWPAAEKDYRKHRKLGKVVFRGIRNGKQIPSITMRVPQAGDAFTEIKADTDQLLRCEYVQTRKNRLLDKGEKPFKGSLKLPWIIDRVPEYFRDYRMNVKIYQGEKLIFTGCSHLHVSPGYYHYNYAKKIISTNLKRLRGLPGIRAKTLREELEKLDKRIDLLKSQLDSCEKVGDKQWNEAAREILGKIRQKGLEWNPEKTFMPYILYSLHHVKMGLDSHNKIIAALDDKEKIADLQQRIDTLKSQHAKLVERSRTCPNKKQELKELAVETAKLAKKNEALEFAIWLKQLTEENSGKFIAFPVSAYTKTFPKKKLGKAETQPVKISLAGNERESFQVYIAPLKGEVENMTISFSPLTKGWLWNKHEIPASNFSWRIVNYMLMLGTREGENPLLHENPTTKFPRPYYPDPLYPGKSFTLPPEDQKTIWVDFYCSPNTPAGEYEGEMTIAAGDSKVDIPIKVKVFGFNLPEKPTLRINHWFAPYYGRMYGKGAFPMYTPEMFEEDCAFLSQYRLPHFFDDRGPVMENIPIYYEGNGRFTADFTKLAKFYEIAEKYGANWVKASFSCNSGAFSGWHNGWYKVIDRKTGKEVSLSKVIPEYYARRKEGKADNLDNPAWQQFFCQFADFLEQRGLLKNNTYYEIYDEQGADVIRKGHKRLREICSKMPLGNYGPEPLACNRWGETSVGYTDIWGPHLTKFDNPKIAQAIHDRVENHGEKCMAYLCNSHNNTPHLAIHRSFLAPRLAHWLVWRHNVDAFLMFKLNTTPHSICRNKKLMAKPVATRFDGPWEIKKGMADWGSDIIQPGPGRTMIPSMRLVALRDGMEDYEYFQLLKTRCDAFKPKTEKDRQLVQTARNTLKIPSDICGKIGEWTTDETKVNAYREKLAELIPKLPPVGCKNK